MRCVNFYGYSVYEDGRIVNRHGRELKQRVNNGRLEIKLSIEGNRCNFMVSRVVYCLFNDIDIFTLDKDRCVTFRDDNKLNVDLSNLVLVDRADLIQGENHKSVSKLSNEQVADIIKKYESTRSNKPTNQHDKINHYNSYKSLAEEYGVTRALIRAIVKKETRCESNYVL